LQNLKKTMASKCGCHGNSKFDEKELLRQIVLSLILGKFNKFGGSRLRTKVWKVHSPCGQIPPSTHTLGLNGVEKNQGPKGGLGEGGSGFFGTLEPWAFL